MNGHITRPAIATLGLLALLSLTACTDPNMLGTIPGDAPIDASAEPTPTDWHSAPAPDEPDWAGIRIEAMTINSEPYRILDGAERYTNVGPMPEMRDPERVKLLESIVAEERSKAVPDAKRAEADLQQYLDGTLTAPLSFDSTVPFIVDMTFDSCTTKWSENSGKTLDEDGSLVTLEPTIFIAKSEDATEGVPISCTPPDGLNGDSRATGAAWFIDPEFSDGEYFVIALVDGARYRQVTPVTISGPTIPHGCRGLGCDDDGKIIWRDAISTQTTVSDTGELITTGVIDGIEYVYDGAVHSAPPGSGSTHPELVIDAPKAEERWWKEPKHQKFFSLPQTSVTGSGTNADPITGTFVALLEGEHRTTRTSTWVLGRDKDAVSGPDITCNSDAADHDSEHGIRYECEIQPFVDSKGKADVYYLILTSQPGDVRQAFKVDVK